MVRNLINVAPITHVIRSLNRTVSSLTVASSQKLFPAFRGYSTSSPALNTPFRKELKDELKRRRTNAPTETSTEPIVAPSEHPNWELTVGLEIHAQLNTDRKLFSSGLTSATDDANTHAALFDLALPGSQPTFQKAVLLPAIRAALALNCSIQLKSGFDRKHYFYQDQPAGYQITQYYAPFAKDGFINLTAADGIAASDGEKLCVGIKQIQLEQDTAKTIQQPPDDMLLDFNRVGQPLIEIITLPHIHHAQTAAACVRKIQDILKAVNSVTTGMELGGLRADINVSVRHKGLQTAEHSYHTVTGLGQRTEIKNLSSFKAVADAIAAERDRQIKVLESGGQIEGETRGWNLGSAETKRLRGKEGEVDYRYMPDPDIAPLYISQGLVDHLRKTLPMLPDEQTEYLVSTYGITLKDAKTLVLLDEGCRLDYLNSVIEELDRRGIVVKDLGRLASNWILHELGGLLSSTDRSFQSNPVPAETLASILQNLNAGKITGVSAKTLLKMVFHGDRRTVEEIIEQDSLAVRQIDDEAYAGAARLLVEQNRDMAEKVRQGQKGKFQWFVGQLIRQGNGKIDAQKAAAALRPLLSL